LRILSPRITKNRTGPQRTGAELHPTIKEAHNGQLEDNRPGVRMRGEGKIAESIRNLFVISRKKYFGEKTMPPFDLTVFKGKMEMQLSLF
jgi:hypothetical protein